MARERSITSDIPTGPVELLVAVWRAHLTVTAQDAATAPTITVAASDPTDPAAVAAADATTVTCRGRRWRVGLSARNAKAAAALGADGTGKLPADPVLAPAVVITAVVPAGSVVEAYVSAGWISLAGPFADTYVNGDAELVDGDRDR